jgi:hypothetical protein
MARILAVALQPSNGVVPPRALLLPLALAPVDGITAIYNFGDSISDTGNHIGEQPAGLLEYIGKLPYGMDIHGPTGRCSHGYLVIDFLGKKNPCNRWRHCSRLHAVISELRICNVQSNILGLPLVNSYCYNSFCVVL